jgi:hypothetical protein
MVGLREDERLLRMINEWRLKPEGMGKKYLGIESMSWHMSVYPMWFNDDLEVRLRIKYNAANPMNGQNLLYVIDIANDRVVYNGLDIDELETFPDDKLVMVESMVNLADHVISVMRGRENELYDFKNIQAELHRRMDEEAHKRLAKRYKHHVEEAQLLGYEIKTYHEFINTLSDEDKDYIQGVWERSIIPD